MKTRRLLRWGLGVVALVLLLTFAAHLAILWVASIEPPHVQVPTTKLSTDSAPGRRFGASRVRKTGKILEVFLEGTPEEIGYAHARLLRGEMVENEGRLLGHFESTFRTPLVRTVLLDLAQFRFRGVEDGMSDARIREIAAGARAFQPDPYSDFFPTFQRFVYLNALYDIALSFEHSPLIGCTSFVLGDGASGPLLARAFDFEVDPIFDTKKAVFLVRENGKIPFASVAWPGLLGVVSGMNAAGLAVVVHGGRAGPVKTVGEPVVHALRRVLSSARTTGEAIDALARGAPMVSHIVVVLDARGAGVVVERVPDSAQHVRRLGTRATVTNHMLGPYANDPKNLAVKEGTSTLDRLRRGEELLKNLGKHADVEAAVRLLRDRRKVGGGHLDLGDRRAIDALIATHGVVFNTRERELWVSEAPHLLGRFVRFDLRALLLEDYDATAPRSVVAIDADPLLGEKAYRAFVARRHHD